MRFKTKMHHDWVVVAVDMSVDSVQALEDLADETGECFGEGDACRVESRQPCFKKHTARKIHTNSAGEHLLIVDITLHPAHQMLDIFWSRHLGWSLVVLRVLPEVLEPARWREPQSVEERPFCHDCQTYSSVAFISGHVCGEQNSVIEP